MKLEVIRDKLIEALTLRIQRELTIMCSLMTSLLLKINQRMLYIIFLWNSLITEIQVYVPVLFSMLKQYVDVKR